MSPAPSSSARVRPSSSTALVTGGGGFLGRAIIRRLRGRGWRLRSFSRGDYPELAKLGVEHRQGDLADLAAVAEACAGCEVVFHVAARAGVWGPPKAFYAANVLGTDNVIAACRLHGVPRLVYTSSASVIFNGRDMEGVDEWTPFPTRYEADYPRTKALAERRVLEANGPELATLALRPHLIWGPGDPHFLPRLVARARAGRLRLVGEGQNRIDTTYVDNAALAHLLAAERLQPGSSCAGRAYFITQGDPRPLRDVLNALLATAGLPPVERSVSPRLAYAVGALAEGVYRALGARAEPPITRFVARELATAHWFEISAARRDLGYAPEVTFEEGLERLAAWIRRTASPPGPRAA